MLIITSVKRNLALNIHVTFLFCSVYVDKNNIFMKKLKLLRNEDFVCRFIYVYTPHNFIIKPLFVSDSLEFTY